MSPYLLGPPLTCQASTSIFYVTGSLSTHATSLSSRNVKSSGRGNVGQLSMRRTNSFAPAIYVRSNTPTNVVMVKKDNGLDDGDALTCGHGVAKIDM
ncbi:hypothetical protein CR513_29979, partial [Mucuna pruriens]